MRSLFITQELAPYFADGGLGATSAALPAALHARHGLRHDIVLPYYPRLVRRLNLRTTRLCTLPERAVAGVRCAATVHRLMAADTAGDIYLIRADTWYDRPGIYRDDAYAAFPDEAERAAYFGWCVADWVSVTGRDYGLVHGNDWQSGAAMAHLRDRFPDLPQLLTIHNGAYRGALSGPDEALGLPPRAARRLRVDSHGRPSLLLAAVWAADAAVTCSTGYARELLECVGGDPMPPALRQLGLTGIQFGVDGKLWDPSAADRPYPAFDAATVESGKRSGKRILQRRLGLRDDPAVPVIGACSRLVPEKGTDLLLAGVGPLLRAGRVQMVLVGPATGELGQIMVELGRQVPDRLVHIPAFDQEIAWLTFTGADLTVMPSRVEPCGLNQLIALRYATLPVVSPVGGLRDTVVDLRQDPAAGTGFHIPVHSARAVHDTVAAALDWMASDPDRLARVRGRLMAQDWSWDATASRYADIYARLAPALV